MRTEDLILVDELDNVMGYAQKDFVHKEGVLHRAFSIFIFNHKKELLLQQRAFSKYHSAGLWTNTCCSHPLKNESMEQALERRLLEEMGITCPMTYLHKFIYRTHFDNGLTEHELDYVYAGITDAIPTPDPNEVHAWRYISRQQLSDELIEHPYNYTVWFKLCMPAVQKFWNEL